MIGRKEAPILRGLVYLGCGKLLQASRANAQLTTETTEMQMEKDLTGMEEDRVRNQLSFELDTEVC